MKALLFGSIGVLADTSAMQLDAINRSFIVHDLDWSWSEEEYRLMLTQAGGQNRVRWYAQSVVGEPLDERIIQSIHKTKTRLFNDALDVDGITLRPGVLRLLEEARSAGVLTAWVTSTEMSNLHAIAHGCRKLTLLDQFNHVTNRATVSHAKPHPAPYIDTLKYFNVAPSQAIAIEDTQVCLASSLAAELTTLLTPTRFSMGQDFSGAVSVVSHLGNPDQPATHLSGSNLLKQGMVSVAQLDELTACTQPAPSQRAAELI